MWNYKSSIKAIHMNFMTEKVWFKDIDLKHSLLCVGKSEHQKNISTSMYFYYFSFNMASSVLLNHRLKWNLTQFLQG